MGRRSTSGPVAPLVQAYIDAQSDFAGAVSRCPQAELPEAKSLALLALALEEKLPAEEALRAVEQVQLDRCDPDTAILLLIFWSAVSHLQRRDDETRLLLKRAWSLVGETTPPELRSGLLAREAALAHFVGDNASGEAFVEEALAVLPRKSPHYGRAIGNKCAVLCAMGRGTQVREELAWLESNWRVPGAAARLLIMRLDDAVDTCRIRDALELAGALERESPVAGAGPNKLKMQRLFLKLAAEQWNLGEPGAAAPSSSMTETGALPLWAEVLDCLYHRRPDRALEAAREDARRDERTVIVGNGLYTTNLIRAELALGHGEAVARLLHMRREAGNVHYLDDFFGARVELLRGNRREAAALLNSALKAAERYGARSRLSFEMALACELPVVDLMDLSRKAGSDRAARTAGPRAEPSGRSPGPAISGVARLLGASRAMADVRDTIKRYASLDAPVLIVGETGTGKELAARALHEEGPRARHTFLAINCGAIADSLLESELFGHDSGAFTGARSTHRGIFEEAGEGTVFLDEIGEISPRLQVVLLRVLESGEIRPVGSSRTRRTQCRIVAATNADLEALAAAGRFRKDLLFRLQRLELAMPPLRERRQDIRLLALHFLSEGQRGGLKPELSPELAGVLSEYDWPGNVRELRNEAERMRLLKSDQGAYDLDALPDRLRPASPADPAPAAEAVAGKLPPAVGDGEDASRPEGRLSTLRRQDRLRGLFRKYGRLNACEIAGLLGVAGRTVTRDLRTLRAEGLIDKVEPKSSPRTHYFRLRESPGR